jgi:peptide/nickel transport system ATP-binding protein
VEVADRDVVFGGPAHPYTRALLAAVPDPTRALAGTVLTSGEDPPAARESPGGCAFHDRCVFAKPLCLNAVPALEEVAPGHLVACHRWREVVYS